MVVALVVGSAWLGHRAVLFSGTSWWNSSGPRAVADAGRVCVCIRHRGSFVKSFSVLTLAFLVVVAAAAMALADALLDERAWYSLEGVVGGRAFPGRWRAGVFLLALATGLVLVELGGVGSATFRDMQNDVMDAIAWLDDNGARLDLDRRRLARGAGGGAESGSGRLLVFGGYSSGGHVAATVTQDAGLWRDRKLPEPHVHCDSMLYISPVLSTRVYDDVLRRGLLSSSSLPSLSPSEAGTRSEDGSSSSRGDPSTAVFPSSASPPPPTWLTDRVVSAVFGHRTAPAIPSPIHTYDRSPLLPHVFLGCRNEMFGLTWLDTFFCSSDYSKLLNSVGIESRYRAVRSDHWNILNSAELRDALREELGRIEHECRNRKAR